MQIVFSLWANCSNCLFPISHPADNVYCYVTIWRVPNSLLRVTVINDWSIEATSSKGIQIIPSSSIQFKFTFEISLETWTSLDKGRCWNVNQVSTCKSSTRWPTGFGANLQLRHPNSKVHNYRMDRVNELSGNNTFSTTRAFANMSPGMSISKRAKNAKRMRCEVRPLFSSLPHVKSKFQTKIEYPEVLGNE